MPNERTKSAIIYLENWQMRMVKDYLGVDCESMEVPVDDHPTHKYGIRPPAGSVSKNMYLTDEQMRQMKDEIGVACNFIELKDDVIRSLYSVPV